MKLLFYFDFLFDLVKGTCVGRELLHHIFFGLDVKINIFLLKRTRQGENFFNIKFLCGSKWYFFYRELGRARTFSL